MEVCLPCPFAFRFVCAKMPMRDGVCPVLCPSREGIANSDRSSRRAVPQETRVTPVDFSPLQRKVVSTSLTGEARSLLSLPVAGACPFHNILSIFIFYTLISRAVAWLWPWNFGRVPTHCACARAVRRAICARWGERVASFGCHALLILSGGWAMAVRCSLIVSPTLG